jgi:hypothetical protein
MPTRTHDTTLYDLYPANALTTAEQLGIERSIPQKTRDSYDAADFAGPDKSFPITSQAQLDAAAHLIGHADDPAAVKAKAISIAKRKGFSLPDAWKEDDSPDRATQAVLPTPDEDNSVPLERVTMPEHAFMYAPIVRFDKEKREVEGVATSEALDSFKTIFSYEASKKAFQKWMERTANVREMHQKKAVAKGIGVRFDDANKKIHVVTRVSRSADGDNTWTKIEEGIINGFSVGADAQSAVWDTITRDGKRYPYLVGYDLAELSLVDNASNPDSHGLLIARADGLTDLVDTTEPTDTSIPDSSVGASLPVPSPLSTTGGVVERVGARVGSNTRSAMHESIGHTLQAAKSQMKNCGCEDCQGALKQVDPDDDGDIDIFGGAYGDTDDDAASLTAADTDRAAQPSIDIDALKEHIDRLLAPYMQRSSAMIARMAGIPEPVEPISPELIRSAVSAEFHNALQPTVAEVLILKDTLNIALERIERLSNQSEVRADLSAVKETVERIAAQPAGGGPVLNGGSYPVDKRLANQPYAAQSAQNDPRAFWDEAMRQGLLTTPDLQMRAATASVIPMSPNRRP